MNKIVRKLTKIIMVGLLLMGYLIIFIVTYGIAKKNIARDSVYGVDLDLCSIFYI